MKIKALWSKEKICIKCQGLKLDLLESKESNKDLCEQIKAKDKWIAMLLIRVEELELEELL